MPTIVRAVPAHPACGTRALRPARSATCFPLVRDLSSDQEPFPPMIQGRFGWHKLPYAIQFFPPLGTVDEVIPT